MSLKIIDSYNLAFSQDIISVQKSWFSFKVLYEDSLKLRPNENLLIRVSPNFIENGSTINVSEANVLQTICDYSLIKDLYANSILPEYLITISLVELRKKGALIVCQNAR